MIKKDNKVKKDTRIHPTMFTFVKTSLAAVVAVAVSDPYVGQAARRPRGWLGGRNRISGINTSDLYLMCSDGTARTAMGREQIGA